MRRHSTELVRLAAPIVVSRSGFLLMVMADTVMTGRFDAAELAYLAIGLGLIMPMLVTSLGLIMGTLVLTANSFGAGRLKGCGPVWRRSLNYAFVLGVVCIGIGYFGYEVLLLTGQTRDVAMHGGEIMWIVSLGLPGHLLFLSSAFFLEGIGRPSHGMVIMILANVLNVVLNWLLIDGPWLSEPMGAAGAAWATTATRWFMAIGLALVVWNLRDRDAFAIRAPLDGGFRSWRELRRIGYAIGLSVGVESVAFAVLNAYAGWLGKIPLAAYGLTLNLMALVFMLALGIGSATAVRVGIAFGRKDIPDAALAGWTGLGANVLVMCVAGVVAHVFNMPLAQIYTDDPALLAEAFVTVAFIAWVFIPDGGQAVMANALRGRRDVWMPTIIQTTSFFGVMVPFGYTSAFVWGNGTVGLFHGILAGCIVSLVALSFRFHLLARRGG
ncbi:MAG: MATE family efflux transporter [Rhodospirillales bacterium]|nr:MATE family efflux transporter [Rhodospirillales bacterium]MBO6786377.1 MATE family efflux transporter [Rhodospirillales bacterium]